MKTRQRAKPQPERKPALRWSRTSPGVYSAWVIEGKKFITVGQLDAGKMKGFWVSGCFTLATFCKTAREAQLLAEDATFAEAKAIVDAITQARRAQR